MTEPEGAIAEHKLGVDTTFTFQDKGTLDDPLEPEFVVRRAHRVHEDEAVDVSLEVA